jgi:hypothetical protein
LLDASRLLRVEDATAPVVELRVDPADRRTPLTQSFHRGDGFVVLGAGLLDEVTWVAGAAAEQRRSERDSHERLPAGANPLVEQGIESMPVVSETAARLRVSVMGAAGKRGIRLLAPWPAGKRWAIGLSHDLDVVEWWPLFTARRVAELLAHGAAGRAARVIASALGHLVRAPVEAGITALLHLEAEARVRSTWFVMCGEPSFRTLLAGDLTYHLDRPRGRRILERIVRGGHELGLHGSFATMVDQVRFGTQRDGIAALAGVPVTGVRQHFLRFRPGRTQRAMAAAGFGFDASYGFPDRTGFRLGVSDVVPGWDEEHGRQSPLEEVPLVWMDRAASKYQRVEDPHRWVDEALASAAICRRMEGLWVGLWHPNLTTPLGFPGALDAYERLVRALSAQQAWFAPLTEVVDWRRARRSVRAVQVNDQAITLEGTAASADPIVIEDANGRPVPAVHAERAHA